MVKVSSKGQIVIPKKIRKKLGIRKNSTLKLRVVGKKIILEIASEPPEDIFVEAGEKIVDETLREVKNDEKALRLLRDLGIED
ncbi:MAG: AbrB/MazE/SpoVT family DNA-binding domain-containing protein [Candidatus Njordarchaeota archaeon]